MHHSESSTLDRDLARLASWVASLTFEQLSPHARLAAQRIVVDGVGAILAGHGDPDASCLSDRLLALGGARESTVLRAGLPRTDRRLAALLNGVAGPTFEVDEGYRLASNHASISIVPAALAQAEATNCSGKDLCVAVVAGYEASARIARAARFSRPTSSYGVFAAIGPAVAIARMSGLDADGIANAICHAASFTFLSSHVQSYAGATVRNLWCGLGAHAGFTVLDLVEAGIEAPRQSLAQVYGSRSGTGFDPAALSADLGRELAVTRNYFKRYACCGHNGAAIDAVLSATRGERIDASEVASVDILTFPAAAAGDDRNPINPMAARFSLPWCVAAAIVLGDVGPEATSDAALADRNIRSLVLRVTVRADVTRASGYESDRYADVTIRMRDGGQLAGRCANAAGDFRNPFAEGVLERKFIDLASRTLGEGAARTCLERMSNVARIGAANEIFAGLGATSRPMPAVPAHRMSQGRRPRERDPLDDLAEFVATVDAAGLSPSMRRISSCAVAGAVLLARRARSGEFLRLTARGGHGDTTGPTSTALAGDLGDAAPFAALSVGTLALAATFAHRHSGDKGVGGASLASAIAALAWGRHVGCRMQHVLIAVAVSMEAVARLSAACRPGRPLDPFGFWAPAASAVAIAKLGGFDGPSVREVISMAACLTVATASMPEHDERPSIAWSAGHAALAGALAALGASCGYGGPLHGPDMMYGRATGGAFDASCLAGSGFDIERLTTWIAEDTLLGIRGPIAHGLRGGERDAVERASLRALADLAERTDRVTDFLDEVARLA